MNEQKKSTMKELHPIICESIRDGGQFVFYPSGTSMLPTIKPSEDCVVLIEPNDIKKHDLILFTRPSGNYVLHRIISIKNGEYTIMGDNQTWKEKISPEQVIAKVAEIRKRNGKVLTEAEFCSTKTIMLLAFTRFFRRVFGKIKRTVSIAK